MSDKSNIGAGIDIVERPLTDAEQAQSDAVANMRSQITTLRADLAKAVEEWDALRKALCESVGSPGTELEFAL